MCYALCLKSDFRKKEATNVREVQLLSVSEIMDVDQESEDASADNSIPSISLS
jgi:hypothetical protein